MLPLVVGASAYFLGAMPVDRGSMLVALGTGLGALAAGFWLAWAGFQARGIVRQVHLRMAAGCLVWSVGVVPYIAYMLRGGTLADTPPWTQVGFLAAYLFWGAALWKLRQPLLSGTRGHLFEVLGIEAGAFLLVAAAVLAALWHSSMSWSANVTLLVPVALDLLMLAAAYNTVRRASLGRDSLYSWLVGAFMLLAACDATVTYAMASGPNDVVLVAGNAGYVVVFVLMALGAGRALHLRETPLAGERLTVAVASIGLAMMGPAAALTTPLLSRAMWVVGAALSWRVFALARRQRTTDEDRLTGLFDSRAMSRHASQLIAGASTSAPVGVIMVDLNGFGRWNAENGFTAGDALLTSVSEALVSCDQHAGSWGRVGPDRFCWVGQVTHAGTAFDMARLFIETASHNRGGLPARAGIAVCPPDAVTGENALAAAEEALEAARGTASRLVAFDQGLLEGADPEAIGAASLRARRSRIAHMIADLYVIRPVFQPIVNLDALEITGYEALSRMHINPRLGPDRWIAEAQRVGLGVELEAECVRRALPAQGLLDEGRYLSVNASPRLIMSGALDDLMPPGPLPWLTLEITEHDQVSDYDALAGSLAALRARGAKVAIDDLGAGHASLRHITGLDPDFAKLDRSFVDGVDGDRVKQALLRSMVAFTRETSCQLIAEGIETPEQWVTLRELGVTLGQGYVFQRPSSALLRTLPAVPLPAAAAAAPEENPAPRRPVAVMFGAAAAPVPARVAPVVRVGTGVSEASPSAAVRLARKAEG